MNKKVNFDQYTRNYNELLREGTKFFSSSDEYFARYKVDLVRKKNHFLALRILEYGCGIGRNIPFLQEAFPKATIEGSDISAGSIEIAKKENPSVQFFMEGTHNTPDVPYDLIFVAGVFHHVHPSQRDSIAHTLFERLVPGGELFVFEHNPFNPITRRIVNNCPYDEDAVLLRPGKLKEHLKKASFSVESYEFCLFIPPKLPQFVWIENWLGWLPLGGQYWIKAKRPA